MCALASLVLCTFAAAQQATTRPLAAGEFESEPIRRAAPTTGPATRDSAAATASATRGRQQGLLDIGRVVAALGIVLGLIFFLRWFGKRLLPGGAGGRGAGAVRVLSRSPVSPKQQVLLMQVGRRVLVVADNGTQMNALSEITDPDEVAGLIGQLNVGAASGSAISAGREAFGVALGAAKQEFDQSIESTANAGEPEDAEPPDAAVASTRGEIDGLMEKVRVLARQLGRS
jgi:flagellar biogenesis protein FliO